MLHGIILPPELRSEGAFGDLVGRLVDPSARVGCAWREQVVDRTCLLEEAAQGVLIDIVDRQRAAGRTELACRTLQLFRVAPADNHVRAKVDRALGNAQADAGAAADDCYSLLSHSVGSLGCQ
ncbi:hypothetical protein D9M72_530380 [compost metagenome]